MSDPLHLAPIAPPTITALAAAHPRDLVTTPTIPPRVLVLSGALVAQVDDIEAEMGAAPEIKDAATCEAVNAVLKRAASLRKDIDSARQIAKAPAQDLVTAVDSAARPYIRRLETVETEAKTQMREWIAAEQARAAAAEAKAREEARVREEAEAKARAEAAARGQPPAPVRSTQALVVAPPPAVAPAIKTRMVRKVKIVDMSLIPDEFWTLNTVALNQAMLREGRTVPGAIVETVPDVVA